MRAYARMGFVEQRRDVSLEDQERQLRELARAYYADRELILRLELDAALDRSRQAQNGR
jgi:ABC-type oligopeptide transport system ATPase subunit